MKRMTIVSELHKTPFPECADKCDAVKLLGVCECESICPHKFKENGDPKKTLENNVGEKKG